MVCAMRWRNQRAAVLLICLALAVSVLPAAGQSDSPGDGQSLILNVYLDITGKALVTGYVDDPEGLPFLNASQFSYENDTNQLYVLTNALTKKEGDIWTLIFPAIGFYDDFRLGVYLPGDFKVKNITNSADLEYFLTSSNDSIAVEFQGYDATNPVASIEYQQPLQTNGPPLAPALPSYLLPGAVILILAIAVAAVAWWFYRGRQSKNLREAEEALEEGRPEPSLPESEESDKSAIPGSDESDEEPSPDKLHQGSTTDAEHDHLETGIRAEDNGVFTEVRQDEPVSTEQVLTEEEEETTQTQPEEQEEIDGAVEMPVSSVQSKIEVSSEMAAVMETLTPRERAVLQALIDRGGRSTQADLRYETRTPKSSLTGIIYSLERRKLITKKEWGRTNVIELSDWFLSKKE
jgi:uncharacterized membrane protein